MTTIRMLLIAVALTACGAREERDTMDKHEDMPDAAASPSAVALPAISDDGRLATLATWTVHGEPRTGFVVIDVATNRAVDGTVAPVPRSDHEALAALEGHARAFVQDGGWRSMAAPSRSQFAELIHRAEWRSMNITVDVRIDGDHYFAVLDAQTALDQAAWLLSRLFTARCPELDARRHRIVLADAAVDPATRTAVFLFDAVTESSDAGTFPCDLAGSLVHVGTVTAPAPATP